MGTPLKVKKNQILNYEFTGAVQTVTLPEGTYKLEVWGAQGGSCDEFSPGIGGAGGYSVGTLTLIQATDFYIYVGGQPATNITIGTAFSGGYNGGGAGYNRSYNSISTYGQGGGGGTDIRIGQDSLYARVIVAGGGGGSASNGDEKLTKYGGGLTGGCTLTGYAGSQTSGGTAGNPGSFGNGGEAYASGSNYRYGSGGGGGGWYGGAAIQAYSDTSSDRYLPANGGGSGYVYTSSTATNYPSGCLLNSAYYLTDAQTIAGNTSFPSTSGGTETGHEGNGYARITVLAVKSSVSALVMIDNKWYQANELFVKVNNVWKACIEGWVKVGGVWKPLTDSSTSAPGSISYTITPGTNVSAISVNGTPVSVSGTYAILASEGDTIIVTSSTFNANTYRMNFSYTPTTVSLSTKTSYGTGTLANTSVTFTMPASNLTVKFTRTSGSIA